MQIDPFAAPVSAATTSLAAAVAVLLVVLAVLLVQIVPANPDRGAAARAEHRRRVRNALAGRFTTPTS